MSRERPLLQWLEAQGRARDYEWLSYRLKGSHAAESLRLVANGYRPMSWDLAFALEVLTGISAHELRNTTGDVS